MNLVNAKFVELPDRIGTPYFTDGESRFGIVDVTHIAPSKYPDYDPNYPDSWHHKREKELQERVIACLNFCNGFDTEELKGFVSLKEYSEGLELDSEVSVNLVRGLISAFLSDPTHIHHDVKRAYDVLEDHSWLGWLENTEENEE